MSARIMMWANYRRGPSLAVPCPSDGNPDVPWWYDKIASSFHELAGWGITDVLFPQPLKTNAGTFPGADGYGPFDDYDIGSKPTSQFGNYAGGIPTRFGSAEKLRRAIAIAHANGMDVFTDHVMHQRQGGRGGVYRYNSATQRNLGRFMKDPGCFRGIPPRVPQDPVPAPGDDFEFGDELCPVNAVPTSYVWDGLLNAGDWLFRTLGVDGARLDDMKGLNIGFIKAFMSHGAMRGKRFFGEYASGNDLDTVWWVDQVNGMASATDFSFHYNMAQPMCNDAGSFNMGSLAGRGMIGRMPMKAVPFVESMDSDTNGFATIIFNKELGYALLLGGEGLPQIYIRDYLEEPDCYGLKHPIQNLCWCAHMLCNGTTIPRLTNNPRVYVFERSGPPGALIALSNDVFNPNWHIASVQTLFSPNTRLHDFTGHNQSDCWVDNNNRVVFGVPPAADGHGYSIWAPADLQGHAITRPSRRNTTQEFEGADDLDIGPLTTVPTVVGRVWCDAGTLMHLHMQNTSGLSPDFPFRLQVNGPHNNPLPTGDTVQVVDRGWHSITANTLSSGRIPYRLPVTYTATRDLKESEY